MDLEFLTNQRATRSFQPFFISEARNERTTTKSHSSPYVNKVPPNPIESPWGSFFSLPTPCPCHVMSETWDIRGLFYHYPIAHLLVWGWTRKPSDSNSYDIYKATTSSNGIESPIFSPSVCSVAHDGAERRSARPNPFRMLGWEVREDVEKTGGPHRA